MVYRALKQIECNRWVIIDFYRQGKAGMNFQNTSKLSTYQKSEFVRCYM